MLLVVSLASFCGNEKKSLQNRPLTKDELYLARSYAKVADARDRLLKDPVSAESLFVQLDSTIDTLRISNTIKMLNENPDRWAFVFLEIEKELRASSQGENLEDTRGGSGTTADIEDNDERHQ
jgi:hypothetical protein